MGNATKEFSLWGAFGVLTTLRLGGALFLTLLVLAVAALSRQYVLTVLVPAAVILLPWLGLSGQLQYIFPLPLPFLQGTGFLRGSNVTTDALTGEKVTTFQELSAGDITRLLILSAIVCLLCLWAIRWRNRTALSREGRKPRGALALVLVAVLVLSGCSANQTGAGEVNFIPIPAESMRQTAIASIGQNPRCGWKIWKQGRSKNWSGTRC